jgi:uncharacterized membrane protein YccC
MSDSRMRTFIDNLARFFLLPRQAQRGDAPVLPLVRVWLFCLAAGAGLSALGWSEASVVMVVGTVCGMLDDVGKGVRNRWPALGVGLLAGWSVDKLVGVGMSAPTDPDWADYPDLALGSLAALAAFAAITRLSGHKQLL